MKYLPSMWIGQLSGRQGSTVATHAGAVSFFRNRIMPVNPRTPAQTIVRDAMTALSQNWKTLTAAERDAWSQLAKLVPLRNAQGVPIILAGNTFYIRFNLTRRTVGLARIDTAPPAVEQPPSFTSNAIILNGTGSAMSTEPTIIDGTATNFFSIWATQFLSPATAFFGTSKYRLITRASADPLAPTSIIASYEEVFGSGWQNMIGMRIGIKVIGVSDSGFEGSSIETSGLII